MVKFLVAPSFSFANNLIAHLNGNDEVESPYKRILVYPVTNGLRMRNLADTKQVVFEVQGHLVYSEYTVLDPDESEDTREARGPLKITNSATDISVIVQKLTAFFEGKWTIK